MKKFLKKNKSKNYVVLDIPLLIENKLYNKNDIIIYIKSKKSIIHKRLKKRKNYNKEVLNMLKSQQLNIKKKINLSNFRIDNNQGKKNILKQIKKIKKNII